MRDDIIKGRINILSILINISPGNTISNRVVSENSQYLKSPPKIIPKITADIVNINKRFFRFHLKN